MSGYGVFSSPYFPVIGLNTEIYSINLRKYGPEKIPYLETFYTVKLSVAASRKCSITITILSSHRGKVKRSSPIKISFVILYLSLALPQYYPVGIYLFKVNNRNSRTMYKYMFDINFDS